MKRNIGLVICFACLGTVGKAQEYTVLPTYVLRSQLFIESGFAIPLPSSWINSSDEFVFNGNRSAYFQLAYDRTFISRPWHLRASFYRANTEVYWTLVDIYGFPSVGGEPQLEEVGIRVKQGVTETAIGLGYRLNPGKGLFVKSTLSLGVVSKGTSTFSPEYHYKGTSGDTVEVIITTSRPEKYGDIGMMAKLDVELGYAINDVHSFGLCAAFAQYGFSKKNTSSSMMESSTLFQVESREHLLLTAMRTRIFSFGLRYSFSFNLS